MEDSMTMLEMVYAYATALDEEEKEKNFVADNFFYDEEDAIRHAYRKRDWHKNKGKRRIKVGYKEKYV